MIGKFLSFVGGFGGFVISLIFFSQLITILAKADFASGNDVKTDNNLKRPETPKVLSKRSKSALDEFGENLDIRLNKKKSKLLRNLQDKQRIDSRSRKISSGSEAGVAIRERESPDGGRGSRIIYLGCVDPWMEQHTTFNPPKTEKFDEDYTPATCSQGCLASGQNLQLAFLKGAQCECAPIYEFNSKWVNESHCDVPCPVKDFKPGDNSESEPCGGNLGYSVYCVPGSENCNDVGKSSSQPMQNIDLPSLQSTEAPSHPTTLAMEELCTVCKDPTHRNKPYHNPSFDYFPANSPESCIDFCASTVPYVGNSPNSDQVRMPTKYALLTWGRELSKDRFIQLPICRCLEEELRELFNPVDPSHCSMYCPGSLDMLCGGVEDHDATYATIYCVNNEDGNCGSPNSTQTTEPPTTDTPETTTDSQTSPSTDDPCSYGFIDCDEQNDPTTIIEMTTTTTQTTTKKQSTSLSTIQSPTTSSEADITTTPSTVTTVATTPETTTTLKTGTSSTEATIPCSVTCEKTDLYGYPWSACANTMAETFCSNLATNATGKAKWKCLGNGKFDSFHPDISDCKSPWVKDGLEEAANITEIGEASIYMEKLEEVCRRAHKPDSEYKYFGRDIASIASMVDKVIFNIQNSEQSTQLLTKFESIIDNAVNISALLIKYRDPWEFLKNEDKSATSTYIFETTESALFNLTKEFSGHSYRQVFKVENLTEENIFKFLMFAETFNRNGNDRIKENYEFPPHDNRGLQDSFIKLPSEWKKLVDKDDVEIAAMSMDGEYVSYTMPGQHELISSANIAGKGDCESKLINGKLISLTVGSSADKTMLKNTRMSFSGKGAEIVFYHDIEAWGEERQDVQRKLHYNEKPRAVLGTTQCVFWDTNKLAWSGNGCHIVKSNRFQTVCECSHLTSFAVLMDVHRYVGKQLALEILTLILCPLSEICLILSIVILSSVNNLQRIRTTITKNLAGCLFVGNGLVLLVLDRNYFNMNEGLCIGSAMLTHYVFLCAFMWMLIEGVQLYRMVIHVFDSGKSYLKHFAVFAYGSPLLVVTITATTGYLQGDKPYGGDVYCWLEGAYIWSFMAPVAGIIMINLVILIIALKTAYQLQQSKTKMSPTFFNGKIRSYRTWFKGCFSLTCILGLTWVVGFFTLIKSPSGIIAAYIFTILNSSQGIFIFLFNCVFNEKVRSFTKRNLSTYLPTWLSSSVSSNPCGNDGSVYGKRPTSPIKSTDVSGFSEKSRKRHSKEFSSPIAAEAYLNIPKAKLSVGNGETAKMNHRGSLKVEFDDLKIVYSDGNLVDRRESMGTLSSVDSSPNSTTSDNGHLSSDTSHGALISAFRSKTSKNN